MYEKILNRSNSIQNWSDTDNLENFKEINDKGKNLYKKTDITYRYNKHGFRCDDFDIKTDFPILFLGCSFTEGIGLPLEHLWTNILLNKIRNRVNKYIPYWSLSLSASGLDTVANFLYWHKKNFNIKIKYIISLLPPTSRREYKFKNKNYTLWLNANEHYNLNKKIIDPVFTDENYSLHQSERSLIIIDSLIENLNSKFVFSDWKIKTNHSRDRHFFIEKLKNHNYVNYPNPEIYEVDYARDSSHPGPTMNTQIANNFWNEYFDKELNNFI